MLRSRGLISFRSYRIVNFVKREMETRYLFTSLLIIFALLLVRKPRYAAKTNFRFKFVDK